MISEAALEALAEKHIPAGVHKYFHVDSRKAWVSTVTYLIELNMISPTKKNLEIMVKAWEVLLYKRYSNLN
jgi:hypothetical protein